MLPHSASQGRTLQRITKLFALAVISIVSVVATQSKTKQNSAVHSNTPVLPWWCSLWCHCVDTQPRSKQNSAVHNNISVLPGVLGGVSVQNSAAHCNISILPGVLHGVSVAILPKPKQNSAAHNNTFCLGGVLYGVSVLPHSPSQTGAAGCRLIAEKERPRLHRTGRFLEITLRLHRHKGEELRHAYV